MIIKYIKVKSFPNRAGTGRQHATWKWTQVIPAERIAEEEVSEDIDDTNSVESYPDNASIGDIGRTAPGILTFGSDTSSPGTPGPSILAPVHTRSYGKAKKRRIENIFINKVMEYSIFQGYKRTHEEIAFISRRVLCR